MGIWCETWPEMYCERRVRARRPHICCETRRLIAPREFYWRIAGVWEGDFHCHKQSEAAYHFARYVNLHLNPKSPCIAFGRIQDDLIAHLAPDDPLRAEWDLVMRGTITRPGI